MNTLYSAVVYAAITLGVFSVVSNVVTPVPVQMSLEYLRFEGGKFHQHLAVSGADAVSAEWSARIWRSENEHDIVLCSGGGQFPYNGEPSEPMTPSYWTDDTCPELASGDRALAVWEYRDENGLVRRISGELVLE